MRRATGSVGVAALLLSCSSGGEPPPPARPDRGDPLAATFDDVVGDALHAGTQTCRLSGDALRCRRTGTGTLVPRWVDGPPALRDGTTVSDAFTGMQIASGEQVSLGDRAFAIRDGVVVVDGLTGEHAPPDAVLVRARPAGVVGRGERASDGQGDRRHRDRDRRHGSAPDPRQTCAGTEVAAVRLRVGGRLAVWASGTWQIYDAPGGPLWCHAQTVTTISRSGERQDCTGGGCPVVGGKMNAPAGAVVAPFGNGVIAAWFEGEVRIELPSHRQLIAFAHGPLRVDRVGIFTHGDNAVLLIHGEQELAVKIGLDGALVPLRVITE